MYISHVGAGSGTQSTPYFPPPVLVENATIPIRRLNTDKIYDLELLLVDSEMPFAAHEAWKSLRHGKMEGDLISSTQKLLLLVRMIKLKRSKQVYNMFYVHARVCTLFMHVSV